MNRTRMYLGGVLAGVFIFFGNYVLHGVILAADWKAGMAALGRPDTGENMASSMALFGAQALLVGIAAAWVYASIRPRYGAGAGTAMRSGLWVWIMVSLSACFVDMAMGLFSSKLMYTALIGDLVIIMLASQIAGALYKEKA